MLLKKLPIMKNNEKLEKGFKYNWEKKFTMINDGCKGLNENENIKNVINEVFEGYPKDIAIKYLAQFK